MEFLLYQDHNLQGMEESPQANRMSFDDCLSAVPSASTENLSAVGFHYLSATSECVLLSFLTQYPVNRLRKGLGAGLIYLYAKEIARGEFYI